MGGTAFAVVQAGSANNPNKRPRGRAVISAVQSTSSTSANVTFVFPNIPPCNGGSLVNPGTGLISYTAIANTGQTGTILASSGGNKIDVNGLAANTVYNFQVFATNEFGVSDRSAPSAAITMQTIAEAPVIGAITTTCTGAQMSITMPTFLGGNTITQTTVCISGAGTGTGPAVTPGPSVGGGPYVLNASGLSQSTTYTFTAFVTTPIGTGRSSSRSATTKGPVTINYMVIAGGGGSGRSILNTSGPGNVGGGGGGGGGVTKGSFVKAPGSVISFTVGTGGSGGPPTVGAGTQGNPSTLTCATTAIGGGYGNGFAIGPTAFNPGNLGGGPGGPGGNGGGSAARLRSGSQPSPTLPGMQPGGPGGTGSQGFNGGIGNGAPGGPPFPALPQGGGGGGGGGAGGAGACGLIGPQSSAPGFPGRPGAGGVGGAGTTWPFTFTGPTITYGSGGGGASLLPSNIAPPSAPGGGTGIGNGAAGGGPVNASTAGATGNTGSVFIAVLTSQYPGTAPGATVSNPPAAPGYTVLRWTTPGSYTV